MKNQKNKQTQNYPIIIGTLIVVILFLFFALNEFKVPSNMRKKSGKSVSSGLGEGSGIKTESQSTTEQTEVESSISDSADNDDGSKDNMSSEEKKRILTEYNSLLKMAEQDKRKLKVSFVRYLDAYEARNGSPDEFFEEWREKYRTDKDSISREKSEVELEKEKRAAERAQELIRESENLSLEECQDMANKFNLTLEEVLTLRTGQIKIMRNAIQTGRTYEYPLKEYVEDYERKKKSGLSVEGFNQLHFEKIGIQ